MDVKEKSNGKPNLHCYGGQRFTDVVEVEGSKEIREIEEVEEVE